MGRSLLTEQAGNRRGLNQNCGETVLSSVFVGANRKIDPNRRAHLKQDGTPDQNDRVEIGPTKLAFSEWQQAGLSVPDLPSLRYPEDAKNHGYDGCLEQGITLCVEAYVGEEGGHEGVKLEEQIVITATGAEPLSSYPYETALMA